MSFHIQRLFEVELSSVNVLRAPFSAPSGTQSFPFWCLALRLTTPVCSHPVRAQASISGHPGMTVGGVPNRSSLEVSEVRSLLCHPLHVFAHHLSLPMRNSSETTAFMSSSCFYFFVDTPPSWTNIQHIFSALEFDTWKSHESCSERLRGDTDCRDLIFNQKLCFPCKAVLQWHMEDSKMTQHFQTWTRPLLQKGSIIWFSAKSLFGKANVHLSVTLETTMSPGADSTVAKSIPGSNISSLSSKYYSLAACFSSKYNH